VWALSVSLRALLISDRTGQAYGNPAVIKKELATMATKNNVPASAQPATPVSVPQGFEERTSDIVGTWNADKGPIIFTPLYATVSDGKKYKNKPSLLIFGRLNAECVLNVKGDDDDDDKPTVVGKPGDLVGVWGKHGMRDLATLCGVEVFMARDVTKDRDTGKDEKMKGYRVGSKEDPNTLIPIRTDRRDASRGERTFLDPAGYGKTNASSPVPISGPRGNL